MLITRLAAMTSLLASSVAAIPPTRSSNSNERLDGTYLIEVQQGVDAEAVVKSNLALAGFQADDIVGRLRINTALFNGYSFSLKKQHPEDVIASIPGIQRVFQVSKVYAPPSSRLMSRPAPPDGSTYPSFLRRRSAFDTTESIHSFTGVSKARQELGLTGKGIKVALINEGVDYHHEALGGGFGPDFKVSFGYDFTGNEYKDGGSLSPDVDPLDSCSSESLGTHAAGIVAASTLGLKDSAWISDQPFTGVAPEASLGVYRVFGCSGESASDIIAAAIYKAKEDGSDIISLSVAGGSPFSDSPEADAATRVGQSGSFVFSGSGDNSRPDIFSGQSPSSAAGGFGVASFTSPEFIYPFLVFNETDYQFTLGANSKWNYSATYEVVVGEIKTDGNDNQDDNISASIINPAVIGKAALISFTNSNTEEEICAAAAKAGAIACILYSYQDYLYNIDGSSLLPTLLTSRGAGRVMMDEIKAGKQVNISFRFESIQEVNGGLVSPASSAGLDQDLNIKPDFGSLGDTVFATVAKHVQVQNQLKTPFDFKSGTSIASSYAAGVAALVLQARGPANRPSFDELCTLLQNTANFANFTSSSDSYRVESVAYQGAGLIDAYRAATTNTIVNPSRLSLNDTKFTKKSYQITVTNKNTAAVSYTVGHQPAVMVTPFTEGDDVMRIQEFKAYSDDYATVDFSEDGAQSTAASLEFTLQAGESKIVTVGFQPPVNATAGLFPVFSGYLVVNANGEKAASVPYAGIVGNWHDVPILARKSASFNSFLRFNLAFSLESKYNIQVADNATLSTGVFEAKSGFGKAVSEGQVFNLTESSLIVLPIAAASTRSLRVEVLFKGDNWDDLKASGIEPSTQLHVVAPALPLNLDYPNTGDLPDLSTPRAASSSPFSRNSFFNQGILSTPTAYFWKGQVKTNLNNAKQASATLPPGKYQIRFAGLKQFGAKSSSVDGDNYDIVLSNTFDIVY
ncbi:hypothetical protein HDU97_009007 [Phlyctochytrium planicorne]|nr:hypothetical protein HDU97_009007 [Phlyctochytrium planicorne]